MYKCAHSYGFVAEALLRESGAAAWRGSKQRGFAKMDERVGEPGGGARRSL